MSLFQKGWLCATLGPIWAMILMYAWYKFFDRITSFNIDLELKKNNIAIGIVMSSIFIGIPICVGLIVGLSLL